MQERLTPREVVQEIEKHRRLCSSCDPTNKALNAEHARWFHAFVMGLVDAERNWELGVSDVSGDKVTPMEEYGEGAKG